MIIIKCVFQVALSPVLVTIDAKWLPTQVQIPVMLLDMVSFTQKDAIKNAQNFEFKIQSYIKAKQQLGTQPVVVLLYIDIKCDVLHVFAFDSLYLA